MQYILLTWIAGDCGLLRIIYVQVRGGPKKYVQPKYLLSKNQCRHGIELDEANKKAMKSDKFRAVSMHAKFTLFDPRPLHAGDTRASGSTTVSSEISAEALSTFAPVDWRRLL